jgi:predicted AlkP superfamily pyrophosphatase or phosphodiesterase
MLPTKEPGIVKYRLLIAALLWLLAVPALAAEPTVILLSWDGTRWDYPDRVKLPALERVAREGVRAERLLPVFPTSTFPNHVSLATGAHVDRHGIVGNVFFEPERGLYRYSADANWINAEPVWVAAERQGVRTASFFWVGSETDWRGAGTTYRRTPFDDETPESEKVDQVLAWLDLPETERPRLIVSWWHGADATGHRVGPDDPDVTDDLVGQDAELARLLAELDRREAWAYTTLLIVSDHGMARVEETVDPGEALDDAGIEAEVNPLGGFGYIELEDPAQLAQALEVLARVEGIDAYASDELPEALHARYPGRTGDITVIATPPLALWRPYTLATRLYVAVRGLFGGAFGMHGYLPSHPDMHAIFYAMGRGVPGDLELGEVRVIDVAPTVSQLLGIEPPRDAEGQPIAGVGVVSVP